MHRARQCAAAKNRREPAEQPWKVNAKPGEKRQKEPQGNHPVKETRVDTMAEQLALVNLIPSDLVEGMVCLLVETLNRGSHWSPPWPAVRAADAAAPPSRNAGTHPATRKARMFREPASPATSTP